MLDSRPDINERADRRLSPRPSISIRLPRSPSFSLSLFLSLARFPVTGNSASPRLTINYICILSRILRAFECANACARFPAVARAAFSRSAFRNTEDSSNGSFLPLSLSLSVAGFSSLGNGVILGIGVRTCSSVAAAVSRGRSCRRPEKVRSRE